VNLRDLILDTPTEPEPEWADAHHYAAHLFGQALATRIVWRVEPDHQAVGTLTGDDQALTLRYEMHEPGSEEMAARVPCAADPACRDAWDTVESTDDLIRVLDGIPGEYGVTCETHPDQDEDEPAERRWNNHRNDLGDWCPWSLCTTTTTDDDDRCPAGCRGSYVS
jgi:hypothetical protein